MSFTFEFKKEHLAEMIKGNPYVDQWYEALSAILPEYGINTCLLYTSDAADE